MVTIFAYFFIYAIYLLNTSIAQQRQVLVVLLDILAVIQFNFEENILSLMGENWG